ncbi:CopY/TcrY family copper transport repressor [Lentilactobacillus diolivorans]|uniref:CopY/TcrY family copper transport repressor n=1 Tax=Lentilactobacillus diolivorans TaxID=179838 RepID=UPI0024691AC6|nr:CopY/TcrY family copper transport repressor [Lentilactobacillus diolivorans]MDH5106777.1 CopY/TcrY family copper transport repressor [Lentilactobacillus diolivorans]
MIDAKEVTISDSEWEVMRAIWTLKRVTSHELIGLMDKARGWSESTTKTLLNRLIKKNAVQKIGTGRPFSYAPAVGEQDSMTAAANDLFDHMCAMQAGTTLANVIESRDLSQDDIKNLQQILAQKAKTAPEMVECNCLPKDVKQDCDC